MSSSKLSNTPKNNWDNRVELVVKVHKDFEIISLWNIDISCSLRFGPA